MTTIILDPGHEGLALGHYLRKGKQSPEVGPGVGIFEGEFNRKICDLVSVRLWSAGVPSIITVPGAINVPLKDRVTFANKLRQTVGKCAFISVHANAANVPGWSSANGCTTYIAPSASAMSGELAYCILADMPLVWRGIRKAQFHVLKKTRMPAVLVECGFMTNKLDAEYMASEVGQAKIADAIADGITTALEP